MLTNKFALSFAEATFLVMHAVYHFLMMQIKIKTKIIKIVNANTVFLQKLFELFKHRRRI